VRGSVLWLLLKNFSYLFKNNRVLIEDCIIPKRRTIKFCIRADAELSSELVSMEDAVAKIIPEILFGVRHVFSQISGEGIRHGTLLLIGMMEEGIHGGEMPRSDNKCPHPTLSRKGRALNYKGRIVSAMIRLLTLTRAFEGRKEV